MEDLIRRVRNESLDPDEFLAPRRCLREPIPEIFHAAHLLDRAVGAHLAGNRDTARDLILRANLSVVRAFTEMLWGKADNNPEQWRYVRKRALPGTPQPIDKAMRFKPRDPSAENKRIIVERDGYHCMYCGMPVIREEVRRAIDTAYAEAKIWVPSSVKGATAKQHAALQCMWLQYDHIFPWSRGGDSLPSNVVVSCAPCNYGRGELTLDEVGIIDPRQFPVIRTSWDGLERFLSAR